MKLLALIIAYLISHVIPKPQRFRNFSWYKSWMAWFDSKVGIKNKEITILVTIAIPVIIFCMAINGLVYSQVGSLIVAVLVLSYCIGPESLEEDVESSEMHTKLGIPKNAGIPLLIKRLTQVSLHRWFGIIFWYMVLGIAGALIYRLSERHNAMTQDGHENKLITAKLMQILNYPVAWMMVISMAIASDFERIYKKCKPSMNFDNMKKLDDTFLYEAADFAVEICEVEEGDEKSIEQVTLNVLIRMLMVWLVFVSILVIFAN